MNAACDCTWRQKRTLEPVVSEKNNNIKTFQFRYSFTVKNEVSDHSPFIRDYLDKKKEKQQQFREAWM